VSLSRPFTFPTICDKRRRGGGVPTVRRAAPNVTAYGCCVGPTDDDALRLNVTTVFVAAAVMSAKW